MSATEGGCRSCIVDPDPSTGSICGTAEEGVGKDGIAAIDAGDRLGVLFTHEFIISLLSLADEVVAREVVTVKTLMSTTLL